MSVPRLRRTVAVTPAAAQRLGERLDPLASRRPARVAAGGVERDEVHVRAARETRAGGRRGRAAWCGWSFTPSMHAYSNVTRRPLARA